MNLNTSSFFNNLPTQGVDKLSLSKDVMPSMNLETENPQFSNMLQQAIDNVNGLQSNTSELRNQFEMGDKNVSLSDVMIAGNKSGLALEATIQVRNKMIEAYKAIMSMPV
ncbi:MAG: flagellar hook-basal body complex protein FliE [Psychromonas sp.]|nr:flagellar hook-basal body complex protein FliE [Psychromonas sp.]